MKANLWRGGVTAKGHLYLMQFHVLGHIAFPGWKEGSVAGTLKNKLKVAYRHTTSSCQSVLTVPSNFFRITTGNLPTFLSALFCYGGKKVFGGFTFISLETSPQDSLIPSSMSSVNSLSLLIWQRTCYYTSHTKKKKKKKSAYFSCLSLYYILLHLLGFHVRDAYLLKKTWQHYV